MYPFSLHPVQTSLRRIRSLKGVATPDASTEGAPPRSPREPSGENRWGFRRSAEQVRDHRIRILGQLAAIGDLAVLDDEQAGKRRDVVLLRERAVRVQADGHREVLAGEEAVDRGAVLLE